MHKKLSLMIALFMSSFVGLSAWAQSTTPEETAQSTTSGQTASQEVADSSAPAQDSQAPAAAAPAQQPAATPPASTPAAAAPAAPQPLPTPSMTAPLQTAVPHEFNGGPFGTLQITGIVSGLGVATSNYAPGDRSTRGDLSNGEIFLQKTSGWFQFYLQAGAYNIVAIGTPFLTTTETMNQLYGPLPVAYAKLVDKNFSVQIGQLPTLIGAEYTFSFENMNVERGLLWNQENAISRGIQINDSYKKLSGSIALTDGFYSNKYSWISGMLMYSVNASNSIMFVGGGNVSQTEVPTFAAPLTLNNSQIYNIIYSYSHENWTFSPYWQLTDVPSNAKIGIPHGAKTNGGAVLLNYNFKHGFSMAGRGEYITSTGSPAADTVNLIYGPGSGGWSVTVTPTYRNNGFFIRGDFSAVEATSGIKGYMFGPLGNNDSQVRGVGEIGFMF